MADRRRTSGKPANRHEPYSKPSPDGHWKHDKNQDTPDVPRGPRAATSSSEGSNDTLVVANLHYEVMPTDLITIFEAMGTLAREPSIKYDRSGRSLGIGFVQFVHSTDAQTALRRLNGAMAKGKPMAISWDQGRKGPGGRPTPTGPKGSGNSLLNRIAAAPLVDRIAKSTPVSNGDKTSKNRSARGNKTGAGAGNLGGKEVGGKPGRAPKTPKTAEELDRELEAYLGDEAGASAPITSSDSTAPTAPAVGVEDVEMS